MEVKVNRINAWQLEMAVEVPAERWVDMLDSAYMNYQKNLKVDGFRPGKVPMDLLKKMYGSAIEGETVEDAVREFYREALNQENIHPVAPADIEAVQYSREKPFSFKAKIEVLPEIEITGLEQLNTYLEEVEAGETDIEAGLEVLREEHAVVFPHEGAIVAGCEVTVDIQETDKAGLPVLTHKINDVSVLIGKRYFEEEFDRALLGRTAGDKVRTTIPRESGKELEEDNQIYCELEIKQVKRKELPELNDEFARSISDSFQNMEDLRKGILQRISASANARARMRMFNRLAEQMIELNRIDVPPSITEWYLEQMYERSKKRGEEVELEEFKEQNRSIALWEAKWDILQKEMVSKFNLECTEQDMEQEIESRAKTGWGDLETLKEYYQQEDHRRNLKSDIEERKVLAFLISKAKITLKKVTYQDFVKVGD